MKKDEILVTVNMASYNHEKYIRQALDSVLMQEVSFRYEILITDDASTDGTAEIIKEYAQKYPDIIRGICRKRNVGPMTNGIYRHSHANGKYIACLECDDYWIDKRKLQQQIDFLEMHPEYSVCYTNAGVIRDNTNVVHFAKRDLGSLDEYLANGKKGISIPVATMVYRNIFHDNPQLIDCYKTNKLIGDRITQVLLFRYGKYKYLPIRSAVYRHIKKGGSSFTSMGEMTKWEDAVPCFRMCIKISPDKNKEAWYVILSEVQRKIIQTIVKEKGFGAAFEYYIKNLKIKEKYYLSKEHWT